MEQQCLKKVLQLITLENSTIDNFKQDINKLVELDLVKLENLRIVVDEREKKSGIPDLLKSIG